MEGYTTIEDQDIIPSHISYEIHTDQDDYLYIVTATQIEFDTPGVIKAQVSVEKIRITKKTRTKIVSLIPFRTKEVVVNEGEHLWRFSIGDYSRVWVIRNGEIYEKREDSRLFYKALRSEMLSVLVNRRILVSPKLLDRWFVPLEEKLLEVYKRIDSFRKDNGLD